jgi:hypothetical protein
MVKGNLKRSVDKVDLDIVLGADDAFDPDPSFLFFAVSKENRNFLLVSFDDSRFFAVQNCEPLEEKKMQV